MTLTTGATVVLVLLILLIVIVVAVLVFMKCKNKSHQYKPYKHAKETDGDIQKLDISSAETRSSSSRSPLFDRRHTPTHLVIPFPSSNPNVTTIHIPVTGTRRLSDTDSNSSASDSEKDEESEVNDELDTVTSNVHVLVEGVSDDGFVDDGKESGTPRDVDVSDTSSDNDQAERDADGEESASWTLSPAHSAPEVNVVQVMTASDIGGWSSNITALESDYEETVYSVYRQEKEVLQSPSTAMPHDQDHTTVVDNHLYQHPEEKKKKKKKRRGLSMPHLIYRHHNKGERAMASSQLLYSEPAIPTRKPGRAGSADSIRSLVEPIGKLFIRLQHKASDEKLLLFINKVTDLNLPERLKLTQGLNPVLYVKGGFLPTMGQRFITTYAALAEDATWCNEFAVMGVSKSAAWQLTMRLYLCFRDSTLKRTQIIGVCDIVLGQMNLENSQEVILNFFSSESQYSDLGDIHISVCYQPTLQRIVFLIQEARDLPRSTLFGSIHSVIKIEMICERTRVEKQKTRVVRETHNPVWNDQLAFTIPATNMRLQGIQFELTVMHVDMVKGAHTIGKCELGWLATCEELQQWNDVMQNPNRPIPMWLSLQYPD